jgi:uncharacterized protein (DUF302 family)
MDYDISRMVTTSFEDTIDHLTSELKKEGFGILTEIDLQAKFKEKLNKEFRKYKILGACNPALAYEAVQTDHHIGVMLPCNILVQEHENGKVEVSAINPMQTIGGDGRFRELASDVTKKLRSVVDKV